MTRPALVIMAVAMGLLHVAGCERSSVSSSDPASASATSGATHDPAWRLVEGSAFVAVGPELGEALERATAEARRTAPEARDRWATATPEQREQWAIKWAAATVDGRVEHVWVVPTTWSAFRIEGVLSSPPRRPLRCGRNAGEIVSFPIEELADWMRVAGGAVPIREGGFTVAVLEERYGRPPPAGGGDTGPPPGS